MENKLFRENSFRVIGTLKNADVKYGTRKDNGQDYISVNATVESMIAGKINEYEVSFFTSKMTKDGKESQLYVTYSKLPELVNKKVDINGELRENRYWSSNLGQMVSAQQLSGRFVKGVADSTADVASYVLGGFIVKTLVEKANKDGNVYRYDLTIGQSNFAGDGMSMFTLHVDPSQRDIVSGVEGYGVGETVKLNGVLNFTVEQVTVQDTSSAFGSGVTKTFTNRQKNFYIQGGSNPIDDDTSYSSSIIKTLIDSYKNNDVVLAEASKGASASKPAATEAPISKRQASLI